MSEFFMYDGDPDKIKYYRKAVDMFYSFYASYFDSGLVERHQIPFEDANIPVMVTKAQTEHKSSILLHGGNDSYYEELFFAMLYFAQQGYDVYLFEGPGQGGMLREQHKCFDYRWENPVKAVLDYFQLSDVTIIGASLGVMLAPRAAAFDKRIRRVVGWSIFPNYLEISLGFLPKFLRKMVRLMLALHLRTIINGIVRKRMRQDQTVHWGLSHGIHAYGVSDPYEALKTMDRFQVLDIGHLLEQDILVLGARQDHFIDWKLYPMELDCFHNARSLTFRLLTNEQSAGNHCNMGNTKLVLDIMSDWIAQVSL